MRKFYYLVLLICLLAFSVNAAKTKKVLIIGIDGCRPDAMMQAYTPNMDILMDNATYSLDALTKPPTWSANGWSSILTGVWGDKHGATDGNSFGNTHFDQYPDFFKFIEEYNNKLNTSSMVVWNPINNNIVKFADYEENFDNDKAMANAVAKRIETENDDVIFIHFDDVDHAGHDHGFNTKVKPYMEAIETTDAHIGRILAGLRSRATYNQEEWLIIVTPDHGGNMAGHGGTSFEERNIFLILSGNTIKNQEIKKQVGVKIEKVNKDYFQAGKGGAEKPFDFGEGKDFTIELRVKTSGWDSDPVLIGDGDWNHGEIKGFVIFGNSNGETWGANIGDGDKRVKVSSSGTPINDNKWHTLSVTFDRDGNMTLYQDGEEVGTESIVDIKTTKSDNPLVIGQDGTTTYGEHFNGSISEVRVWTKALSAQSIKDNSSNGILKDNPNYEFLQSYWEMDEGTGNEVKDSKGDVDLTHYGQNSGISWDINVTGVKIEKSNKNYFQAGQDGADKPFDFGEGKDFSIELRVKTSGWSSDPVLIGDGDWNHGYIKGFIIYAAGNGESWGANIGEGEERVKVESSGAPINDDKWHTLSVTFDRDGNMTLYQDGENVGSASIVDIKTSESTNPLVIGQDGTTTYGEHFDGNISEVRVWTKVLDAESVRDYYNQSIEDNNPNYDALQAYWIMTEATDNKIKDRKGDVELTYHGLNEDIVWAGGRVGVKIEKQNKDYFQAGQGGADKPFDFGEGKDFSIELRVKTSGWSSDPVLVGDGDWNHGYIKGFIIYAAGNGKSWGANIGEGEERVKVESSGAPINDDKWHTLSVTFDRDGNMTLYQDGENVGSASIVDIKTSESTNPLVIGQDGTTTYGEHFDGDISEVRVWTKVLDAESVKDYYNQSIEDNNPNYDALQAYWTMTKGNRNTVEASKGDVELTHHGLNANVAWDVSDESFANTPRIVDIAATVLDFLGIEKPAHYDGMSRLEKTTFVPKKPIAHFGAEKTTIFSGKSVQFYDESGYDPTSYAWEFEGGVPATSTEKNPIVKYDNVGEYKVKLTATNAQGTDSKEVVGYIVVKAPYEVHQEPIIYFPFNGNAKNVASSEFNSSTVEKVTFDNNQANLNKGLITIQEGTEASKGLPKHYLSVFMKVKLENVNEWGGYFGCFQDNGSYERGWLIGNEDDKFCFVLASEKTKKLTYMKSEDKITTNKWYSLLATYDGETMKLYVDGELKASTTAQQGDIIYPDDATTYFQVGSYKDENEDFRNEGVLDEIKVWDRALTDEEINSLFTSTGAIQKNNHSIKVYPNPSQGVFTVDVANIIDANYKVYSLKGVELQKGTINNRSTRINIKNQGTYILKVNTNSKLFTSKIIIQ